MPMLPKVVRPTPTQRAGSTERGYNARWQRARAAWLAAHPFCSDPHRVHGPLVTGNEVDHITPHRGNTHLMWSMDNWQTLCKVCHSRKTMTEGRGWSKSFRVKALDRFVPTRENPQNGAK